jgi:hypothetical protein
MADGKKEGMRIETERVILRADVRAEIMQLVADWVAMQVSASLDPDGTSRLLADRAGAADFLAWGLTQQDRSAAQDMLLAHLQATLADSSASADRLLGHLLRQMTDRAASADALQFGQTQADVARGADVLLARMATGAADAAAAVDDLVSALMRPLADASVARDPGSGYLQTYVNDYVEPDYVGDAFTF